MAAVPWATGVNQAILADGFSVSHGNNIIEFKPDVGPVVYRRRATKVPRQYAITLRFENKFSDVAGLPTEFGLFETFVNTTLAEGTKTLVFKLPTVATGTVANTNCRFIPSSGAMYKVSKIYGEHVWVSFVLEEVL